MPIRLKHACAASLLAAATALTGCLSHTHSVPKARLADAILSAPLESLLQDVDARNKAIQSMTAIVQIATSTGGSLQGEVKESIAFSGAIIVGNPDQLHIILQVPVLGSRALDMVSDGKTFKMLIPPKSCAITGSDILTGSPPKGLYGLRPAVILDSMLIRGLEPGRLVSLTQDSRIFNNPGKKNDLIEEPDYDLEFLAQPVGSPPSQVAHTLHVIHIGRGNLLPYQQDVYQQDGRVATQAFYSDYKKFGDIDYPTKIVIKRPLDELGLTITISKATFNQKLDPEQFKLDIPATTEHITDMDDPASLTVRDPCAMHAPQSPR